MTKLFAKPISGDAPPRPNLLEISRDIVSRTPEGKEALIAMRAIRDWKSSAAIRARFPNFIDYYDKEHAKAETVSDLERRGEAAITAGKSRIVGGRIVTIPPRGRKGTA